MRKQVAGDERGIAHLLLIVVIVVVGVVVAVGARVATSNKENTDTAGTAKVSTNSTSEPDVSLQNLGLASLDSVRVSTDATREFSTHGLKGFYIFGDTLSGGRSNPNFEFASLKDGTKVVSAIDGVVAFIKEQSSNDVEVFIQPKEGSMWTVGYDHIANLAVKKGDPIKVGAVIGEPAMQNNGLTRFEIQINKDKNGITTHYCPSTLLAADVKETILNGLTTMQNNWEKTTGLELYDLSKQSPVGCTKLTMTPQEAEGQ